MCVCVGGGGGGGGGGWGVIWPWLFEHAQNTVHIFCSTAGMRK